MTLDDLKRDLAVCEKWPHMPHIPVGQMSDAMHNYPRVLRALLAVVAICHDRPMLTVSVQRIDEAITAELSKEPPHASE